MKKWIKCLAFSIPVFLLCIIAIVNSNVQKDKKGFPLNLNILQKQANEEMALDEYVRIGTTVNNSYDYQVLSHKEKLFVDNSYYEFENGKYNLKVENINALLPEKYVFEYSEEKIIYCKDYIVYLLQKQGEQILLFMDAYTLKVESTIPIEQGKIYLLGTYENCFYFEQYNENNGTFEICRCNCETTEIEILQKNSEEITSGGIRADGTVVFYMMPYEYGVGSDTVFRENSGYYKLENGRCTKIREAFEYMRYYISPILVYCNDSEIYLLIEYQNHQIEIVCIGDNVEERRIKINTYTREFFPYYDYYLVVQRDGTIEKYAYEYATHDVTNTPEYLWEYDALPLSVDHSETLSDEMLGAGYSLSDAIKDKDCIWLFFQNEDKELIVKKYEVS